MSPTILRTALMAGMLGSAGCTTAGPDFHRPAAAMPDRWSASAVRASSGREFSSPDARWWKVFNDAE